MIYTVTLNPSIDYHVTLPALTEGTINEVQKEWKVAGGKGINVSKVLRILGVQSTALGFIGGFTGSFIQQQIEEARILHQFIRVEQDSRINLKIKAGNETEITGQSPAISEEALQQLLGQLDMLQSGDYLVLAGSIPKSLPSDIYHVIMKRLRNKGVHLFLDAKGEALRSGLSEKPFLIKPNHHELGELFDTTITTTDEAAAYGRKAMEMGAKHVIVSMADQGAVLVSEQGAFAARIPQSKAVNSIGAGDSMVAGFLYAHIQGWNAQEAFRFAVAAGSTTALSEGFCNHEKIASFLPNVSISIIE